MTRSYFYFFPAPDERTTAELDQELREGLPVSPQRLSQPLIGQPCQPLTTAIQSNITLTTVPSAVAGPTLTNTILSHQQPSTSASQPPTNNSNVDVLPAKRLKVSVNKLPAHEIPAGSGQVLYRPALLPHRPVLLPHLAMRLCPPRPLHTDTENLN